MLSVKKKSRINFFLSLSSKYKLNHYTWILNADPDQDPGMSKIRIRISNPGSPFFQATIKTELYPRSQIDIFVEVLQADGGNYCACVNAATLALIDAGIPLKDYVTACTASLGDMTRIVKWNNLLICMKLCKVPSIPNIVD